MHLILRQIVLLLEFSQGIERAVQVGRNLTDQPGFIASGKSRCQDISLFMCIDSYVYFIHGVSLWCVVHFIWNDPAATGSPRLVRGTPFTLTRKRPKWHSLQP